VQYIIHIPDEHERYKFAAKIKKILTQAKMNPEEYIPGNNTIYKTDIGIKANVSQKVLAQVLRQIEARGYTVINAKGSENPSLQHSGSSPQQSQKTIGEITHGII
tara:strand:+ start:3073 stop:3387 length:315 start_codon:yes stop_codon:yes gene_type:complete